MEYIYDICTDPYKGMQKAGSFKLIRMLTATTNSNNIKPPTVVYSE